jgi:DNA polymerase III subunit delta
MPAIAEDAYFKLSVAARDKLNGILLYGTDEGLVAGAVRKIAMDWKGDEEPQFLTGAALRSDPALLEEAFGSISLFGGRRVVIIEGIEESHLALTKLLFDPARTGNYVVLTAGSLNKSSALRSAAEQSGVFHALGFYEESEAELASRARRLLQVAGLAVDEGVDERLAELCGGERAVLEGEVSKLALYLHGSERVTLADVDSVCGSASAFDAAVLVEAMMVGDFEAVDQSLSAARESGESAQMLNVIKWQVDRMHVVRAAYEQSKNWDQSFMRAKPPVHFKAKDRWRTILSKVSAEQMDQLQRRLQDAILQSRREASVSEAIAERFILASTREMRQSAAR